MLLLKLVRPRLTLPLTSQNQWQIYDNTLLQSAIRICRFRATIVTMPYSKSWLPIPPKSDFSLSNIPFGIITSRNSRERHRPATIIGDHVLDLLAFSKGNGFSKVAAIAPHLSVFEQPTLNAFAALGQSVHNEVRAYLQEVFAEDSIFPGILKDNEVLRKEALLKKEDTKNHLPMQIGDYSDFFAGRNHAHNLGSLFRDPKNALQPNYNFLPVGYHGRASSIVVSGTPITRPHGQILLDPSKPSEPTFNPSKSLDIELELAAFLCTPNPLGQPISIAEAKTHIFGYVLMNDWSARDIQRFEYVPLGPFTAKSFATTISPWVVLPCALAPFLASTLPNPDIEKVAPYLTEVDEKTVPDISLSVELTTPDGGTTHLSTVSSSNLQWSFPQMITHHTISGCNLRTGDLIGSGTISGNSEKGGDLGSLIEMNKGGKEDIMLNGMDVRRFLRDGDRVVITGYCGEGGEGGVGFGECEGTIEGAVDLGL